MDVYEVPEEEQRTQRKRWLGYPNVHDVDSGFEFTAGEPSGRRCACTSTASGPSTR